MKNYFFSKLIFFNNFHNGDLHYSREYIKYFKKQIKVPCYISHKNCPLLLSDINIPFIMGNFDSLNNKSYHIENNTLFVNTWIGQENMKWLDPHGCSLKSNYKMFTEKAKFFNFTLPNETKFIPSINYSVFKIDDIKIKTKNNIFISNGNVHSGQSINFNFESLICKLSEKHPLCNFYITQKINTKNKNIFDCNEIARNNLNTPRSNLNELSYISTFCDIIVGRASGPYCFSHTKENLYNPNKTFIVACNELREGHWALMEDYDDIQLKAKQMWSNTKNTHYHEEDLLNLINKEITIKFK